MRVRMGSLRLCAGIVASIACLHGQEAWRVHDRDRPNPPVVTPSESTGGAPSDALVLFDGHNLDQFESQQGGPAPWTVADGTFTVKPGSGSIQTKREFGDCQLHAEWASPNPPQGEDQMRGNSGIIIMGLYELQVLDSYNARTYADGQAGAIYGQYPPLVNAAKAPGAWQVYDVIFRRPKFDKTGRLISRARETVIYNGVVVQDATELSGPTAYHNRPPYFPLPEKLPFVLQDHGTPVRYRNIWIRELPPEVEPLPVTSFVPLRPDPAGYVAYAGTYEGEGARLTLTSSGPDLKGELATQTPRGETKSPMELVAMSDDAFTARSLPGADLVRVVFARENNAIKTVTMFHGGHYVTLTRR